MPKSSREAGSKSAFPLLVLYCLFQQKVSKSGTVYEALFANSHPCDRLILLGAWLTGRRNPRAAVNGVITGFGSTRQRDHGRFGRADQPSILQQGKLEVQTDEK